MTQGNPPYGRRDEDATNIDRTAQESGSQIKETIEDATRRVREKVSEATEEVRDKAGNATQHVREQVAEAAEQVRGFDVQQQVRSHPWMALGVAAVAGYVFGSMGGGSSNDAPSRSSDINRYRADQHSADRHGDQRRSHGDQRASKEDMDNTQAYYWSPGATHTARPGTGFARHEPYTEYGSRYSQAASFAQPQYGSQAFGQEQHEQRSQLWDNVRDQFGDEFRTLMTAAIGAAISLVRDTVSENVPQFAEEYDRRRHEHDTRNQTGMSSGSSGTYTSQSSTNPSRPLGTSTDQERTAQHTPTFGTESGVEQRSGFTEK